MEDLLLILSNEIREARPDLSVEVKGEEMWITGSFDPILLKLKDVDFVDNGATIDLVYEPNLEVQAVVGVSDSNNDVTEIISLIELREMEEGLDPMDLQKAPYENSDDKL